MSRAHTPTTQATVRRLQRIRRVPDVLTAAASEQNGASHPLSVRGLEKVRGEWDLVCLALNIRRLLGLQGA